MLAKKCNIGISEFWLKLNFFTRTTNKFVLNFVEFFSLYYACMFSVSSHHVVMVKGVMKIKRFLSDTDFS